ncbi:MAG: COP23 domain-containing protein [Cyanosarcina radialis HA8281-LM2]|jgi:hypothetical protein|nr:COP23 domain-containing protein [Cyanosarcina radialis HA8281-LM2]
MKLRLFAQVLAGVAIALGSATAIEQPSYAQSDKFYCGMSQGKPATIVRTSRGSRALIQWTDTSFGKYTPQVRCERISTRFREFYNNGTLKYLRAGRQRNQPVLCVAGYQGGPCLANGVLITLKPTSNPVLVLQSLRDFQGSARARPIELAGDNKDNLITYNAQQDAAYLDIGKMLLVAESPTTPTSCPPGVALWEC